MKEWNKGIADVLYLMRSSNIDNITYCLGCCGEVAGRDSIVESQFKYYYTHGWNDKIGTQGVGLPGYYNGMSVNDAWNIWLSINKGKQCFDCSGLICWFAGFRGEHKYSSWDVASMKKNKSASEGPAGSVLWKSGHVALDIGYGFCVEIGLWNDTIQLNKISERDFTSSHLMVDVTYINADNR